MTGSHVYASSSDRARRLRIRTRPAPSPAPATLASKDPLRPVVPRLQLFISLFYSPIVRVGYGDAGHRLPVPTAAQDAHELPLLVVIAELFSRAFLVQVWFLFKSFFWFFNFLFVDWSVCGCNFLFLHCGAEFWYVIFFPSSNSGEV